MKYDAVKIEIYDSGWTDVSTYIVRNSVSWNRGISGNSVKDRVARPGRISFTLHDTTGQFDPIYTSAVLASGTAVRFSVEKDGIGRYLWYGKIKNVAPREDDLYKVFATVTGACVIDEYNRPLVTPTITTNKTASEAVDEVNSDLGLTITTAQKEYGTMDKTFTAIFDTAKSKQNALGEISKAIMSELGYFYAKGTRESDDNYIIAVDGRDTRENRSYITIPVGEDNIGFILQENGDYVLQENGDKIIIDEAETFDEFTIEPKKQLSYGKNVLNDIIVTVYPKEYSASTEVVYSITNTPGIDAGDTLELLVKYRDPDQEAQSITARSTLTPVATTDYTANADSDGGGADMTSDLTVTAVYGAAEIKYTLENTSGTKLYVTKLQARGEGIFFYSTVRLEAEDSTSQGLYGYKVLNLNQKYLDDEAEGQTNADAILAATKDVFQDVDWIEVNANASSENLFACMYLDIGDPIKIPLKNSSDAIVSKKFYINGISWSGSNGNWTVRYNVASQEVTEI